MAKKRTMEKQLVERIFFPLLSITVCGFYQSPQEAVLLRLGVVLRLSEQALQRRLFAV